MQYRLIALIVLAWTIFAPIAGAQEAIVLGSEAQDAGLTMTAVATQLDFPVGMTPLPDGSLLVATNPSDEGVFYSSWGRLLRLKDSDGDGSLDQQTTLADNLPGGLVAVARYGEIVVVTSSEIGNEQIMFFRRGEHWRDPLTEIDRITFTFNGTLHQSYALAVRPNADDPAAFDLFFNVGAYTNTEAGNPVQAGAAISDLLTPASIYMITVTDTGDDLTVSPAVLIATGLRNGTTLAIRPGTGDLWIGENGIDGLGDATISFSADELDIVPADKIGKEVIDFGFPGAYIDYATGEVVGHKTDFVDFRPINGSKSEGVAGIVFVPDDYPAPFGGGILAGFHGQFDWTGTENDENPLLWINPKTGEKLVVVENDSTEIGHLDSMTVMDGTVYVADFCDASMIGAYTGCGIIYALTAPAT
jgi:glucose/arabinose dehydrogenase